MSKDYHLNSRARRTTSESGAVLVEAAIAIPLLITLLAGIINLGLGFVEQSELTEAVRNSGQLAYETELVENCGAENPPETMCLSTLKSALTEVLKAQATGADLSPEEFVLTFQEAVQSGSLQPYLRIQMQRTAHRSLFTDSFSIAPCASTLTRIRFRGDTSTWPQVEEMTDACS